VEHHPEGSETCQVCGAPTHTGFRCCFCCGLLVRQLGMPLAPLEAVTTFRAGDALHRQLRGYKDAPVAEVRMAAIHRLAALMGEWLDARRPGGRLGTWDLVVAVPSSRRPGTPPVEGLVAAVPALARGLAGGLLLRGPGRLDHLVADRRGFAVDPKAGERVAGRRVLVVDDTVVTGARAQSAVAALRSAGLRPVGVLAVGRTMAPDTAIQRAAHRASPAGPGPGILSEPSRSGASRAPRSQP